MRDLRRGSICPGAATEGCGDACAFANDADERAGRGVNVPCARKSGDRAHDCFVNRGDGADEPVHSDGSGGRAYPDGRQSQNHRPAQEIPGIVDADARADRIECGHAEE